jgi:hypothetical protein
MRIATVQMHDGPKIVVEVDCDHRQLDFDSDSCRSSVPAYAGLAADNAR